MASLLLGAPPMAALSSTLTSSLSFSQSQSLIHRPSLLAASPISVSLTLTEPNLTFIYCGRGDKKTARGKRFNHSFGNARRQNKSKGRGPPRVTAPPLPPRKDKYDDGEVVRIQIDES